MEVLLNKDAYKAGYGNVVYDSSQPLHVSIIEMDSPGKEVINGTVIGKDDTGAFYILGAKKNEATITGEAVAVTCETMDCTGVDGKVNLPVYESGNIDKNYLITENDYELTDDDVMNLRKNGIFLSESMK